MQTTLQEIVDYWELHQNECGLSVDWSEAHLLCWRCAHRRRLQRCHIVPRALGGSEAPSNLVLLCAQCHAEAPNVLDPDFMWTWLRRHAVPHYGTYWYHRGLREYEFIYQRKPFASIQDESKMWPLVDSVLTQLFPKTNLHWGQGKINPCNARLGDQAS